MTFTASDVLLKAASRIEEEGMWCQGEWFRGFPRVFRDLALEYWGDDFDQATTVATRGLRLPECATAALASVAVELEVGRLGHQQAWEVLCRFLDQAPTFFNDTPGRTAHEVAEAMRQAALQ